MADAVRRGVSYSRPYRFGNGGEDHAGLGELAAIAVLPATLITDFETGVGAPEPRDLDEIKSVLEWAGVEFIDGGVKLRKGK